MFWNMNSILSLRSPQMTRIISLRIKRIKRIILQNRMICCWGEDLTDGQGRARCAGQSLKFIVLSPLHSVIEPTGRFHNDMEKESGIAERLVSSFKRG